MAPFPLVWSWRGWRLYSVLPAWPCQWSKLPAARTAGRLSISRLTLCKYCHQPWAPPPSSSSDLSLVSCWSSPAQQIVHTSVWQVNIFSVPSWQWNILSLHSVLTGDISDKFQIPYSSRKIMKLFYYNAKVMPANLGLEFSWSNVEGVLTEICIALVQ